MKDNKKERKQFVDIAKGICILLIARGHLNYDFSPLGLMKMNFIQFGMFQHLCSLLDFSAKKMIFIIQL